MGDKSKYDVDPGWYYHNGDLLMPEDTFPAKALDHLKDFKFRKNDLLSVNYPKTGSIYLSLLWSTSINMD